MKCVTHQEEATAICPYCGRALCGSCERMAGSGRTACSAACAEALAEGERATQLILKKHVQGVRVAAYFLYALGITFIGIAIIGFWKEPQYFMPHLVAAVFGIVLTISGIAYHRLAGRRTKT